jgi:DNA-directed RNA polymerase I, II, and III subunit RPABC5
MTALKPNLQFVAGIVACLAGRGGKFIPGRSHSCSTIAGGEPVNTFRARATTTMMLFTFSDALDALELKRYCCRRMVLTRVDLIEKLLHYNRACLLLV